MAYEIKTYYLDVSYYLENPTVPNLDSLRRAKINKTIEIFKMTGGNWVTEQQTWYDENGILHEMQVAVGRYATLENFPFIFYVEAGRNSSSYGSDRMSGIAIINPKTQAYINTNFSLLKVK